MIRRLGNAMLATGSSQIFWFLSLPFIGKLYTQEEVGIYGQIIAYAGTIGLVIGARSDLAVLTSPPRAVPHTRSAFTKLAMLLILPVGAIAIMIGYASKNTVLELPLLPAVLVGGYLANLFLLNGVSLVRSDDYASLRNTGLLRSAVQALIQLSSSALGLAGLVGGKLLGDLFGVLSRRNKLDGAVGKVRPSRRILFSPREKIALKRNIPAFKYSLPQSIVNAVAQNSPFFLLPIALSSAEMGSFAMAFALVIGPVGLIGAPIRQTFIAQLSISNSSAMAAKLLLWSTLLLLMSGLIGCALFYLMSNQLIYLLFGNEWLGMVGYAKVLILWAAAGLLSTPSVAFLLAKGKNKLHMQIEFALGAARVMALVLGVFSLQSWKVIGPFVAVSVAFSFVTIGFALSLARRNLIREGAASA